MWPAIWGLSVSRESADRLKIYHELLLKWQNAINLVSPKTIKNAWERHFADSVQVEKYVSRESMVVADLGSGGGFPGMVLAVLRPDLDVHLVESDERKCQFIKAVSRETEVPVKVHSQRIEAQVASGEFVPDLVTARALADLPKLLGYILPWAEQNPALECLFMKGMKCGEEVRAAKELYDFDLEVFESVSDPDGRILKLTKLSRKKP